MASSKEFAEFVCEQITGTGDIRYKKMFGEYMVYLNDKPVIIICDNTAFVKILDCIAPLMVNAQKGKPYEVAKEHYILDVDDRELCCEVVTTLEKVIPIPKKRKK